MEARFFDLLGVPVDVLSARVAARAVQPTEETEE